MLARMILTIRFASCTFYLKGHASSLIYASYTKLSARGPYASSQAVSQDAPSAIFPSQAEAHTQLERHT